MTQTVRFRMPSHDAAEWEGDFKAALLDDGITSGVEISRPGPPIGLPAIDPTIVVAAISGGASVLAAIIAAFATVWAKRKSEDKVGLVNLPVGVVVEGSRDSLILPLELIANRTGLTTELEGVYEHIGVIGEISIERA
jgi:hypothetical protein